MLKAAAERGVKVNIVVYKEVTQALTRKYLNPTLCLFFKPYSFKSPLKLLSLLSSLASDVVLRFTFYCLETPDANYPIYTLVRPMGSLQLVHITLKHRLSYFTPISLYLGIPTIFRIGPPFKVTSGIR